MGQSDTKQKIIDAAEHLFARNGYHSTTLRQITAEAGVNLAAVNYHFGNKEFLLEATILRRLTPLNAIRSSELDKVLNDADKTGSLPSSRDVLRAFVEPTLQLREKGSEAEDFIALVGRAFAEPRGIAMTIFFEQMAPLMGRFFQALSLSLPNLSQQDLVWRLHFMIGSMSHVMRCHERHSLLPEDVDVDLPVSKVVDSFLDYATAGMEVGA